MQEFAILLRDFNEQIDLLEDTTSVGLVLRVCHQLLGIALQLSDFSRFQIVHGYL